MFKRASLIFQYGGDNGDGVTHIERKRDFSILNSGIDDVKELIEDFLILTQHMGVPISDLMEVLFDVVITNFTDNEEIDPSEDTLFSQMKAAKDFFKDMVERTNKGTVEEMVHEGLQEFQKQVVTDHKFAHRLMTLFLTEMQN